MVLVPPSMVCKHDEQGCAMQGMKLGFGAADGSMVSDGASGSCRPGLFAFAEARVDASSLPLLETVGFS